MKWRLVEHRSWSNLLNFNLKNYYTIFLSYLSNLTQGECEQQKQGEVILQEPDSVKQLQDNRDNKFSEDQMGTIGTIERKRSGELKKIDGD